MNRIIKFRVWDKNKKVMMVAFPHDTNWELQNDPYITMQFTGLTDKQGKEIYEGDIVVEKVIKYIVEYDDNQASFAFNPKPIEGEMYHIVHKPKEVEFELEVIGNIYENKDLLADRK